LLNGAAPVAPSPIAAKGNVSLLRPERPFATPRALRTEEIPGIVEAFGMGQKTPSARDSTAWSCTAPMATCWTNSCKTAAMCALMRMAAPWKIVPDCCSKPRMPPSRSGVQAGLASI